MSLLSFLINLMRPCWKSSIFFKKMHAHRPTQY